MKQDDEHMKKDDDLKALLGREDFMKLVPEQEVKQTSGTAGKSKSHLD